MKEKFKDIPVEEDTNVLERQELEVSGYEAVYERWSWEAIKAESYIFFNDDLGDISKDELLNLIGKAGATYKKGQKYTFVNFGFETD